MCCLAPDICAPFMPWDVHVNLFVGVFPCIYIAIEPLRAPSLPLECYHGNCYCDSVELLRVGGVVTGLSLKLIADGRSATHSELRLW